MAWYNIEKWNWNSSNGRATRAQTESAYRALYYKTNTTNFHHYVWNDLVNKVVDVLEALNLIWNSSYATKSSTYINSTYGKFTAKVFNSVILNSTLNNFKWEIDNTQPGYTGRKYFQGITEAGEASSDLVYGWYILEFVDRLNELIDLINKDKKAVELSAICKIISELDSILSKATSQRIGKSGETFAINSEAVFECENLPSMQVFLEIKSEPSIYCKMKPNPRIVSFFLSLYMYAVYHAEAEGNESMSTETNTNFECAIGSTFDCLSEQEFNSELSFGIQDVAKINSKKRERLRVGTKMINSFAAYAKLTNLENRVDESVSEEMTCTSFAALELEEHKS